MVSRTGSFDHAGSAVSRIRCRRPMSTTRSARASTRCAPSASTCTPGSRIYSSPHDPEIRSSCGWRSRPSRSVKPGDQQPEYGLLSQVTPEQTNKTLGGAPTPDDLDALLTKVWKTPARSSLPIRSVWPPSAGSAPTAAFPVVSESLRRRSSSPGAASRSQRQIAVVKGKTKFIWSAPAGHWSASRPVQPGLVGEQGARSVGALQGSNTPAVTTWCRCTSSLAVLTDDALAVLEGVAVDQFHEYKVVRKDR